MLSNSILKMSFYFTFLMHLVLKILPVSLHYKSKQKIKKINHCITMVRLKNIVIPWYVFVGEPCNQTSRNFQKVLIPSTQEHTEHPHSLKNCLYFLFSWFGCAVKVSPPLHSVGSESEKNMFHGMTFSASSYMHHLPQPIHQHATLMKVAFVSPSQA